MLGKTHHSRQGCPAGKQKWMYAAVHNRTGFARRRNSKKLPHEISAWNYILTQLHGLAISSEVSTVPGRGEVYVSHASIYLGLCLSSVAETVINATLRTSLKTSLSPRVRALLSLKGLRNEARELGMGGRI